MGIIRTEAIVLKQYELGEADKIITFYTKDYGKIRAVAKGVRKSRSSMSGIVLPFNYNYVTFYQGKSLDRINQVRNIFSFTRLREDLIKMAYASFIGEIIEKVGLENQANKFLFSLLLSTLHTILEARDDKLKYIELIYKIRLLVILGLKPQLDCCAKCNCKLIYQEKNFFDIEHGGLICKDCFLDDQRDISRTQRYILSLKTVELLNFIINSGLEPLSDIDTSEKEYQKLDQLSNQFMYYHLDLKLKSYDFLNMIKKLG